MKPSVDVVFFTTFATGTAQHSSGHCSCDHCFEQYAKCVFCVLVIPANMIQVELINVDRKLGGTL